MIENQKQAVRDVAKAVKEAKLAYEFKPSSYTYGCLLESLATQQQILAINDDWGCPQAQPQSGWPVTK